MSVKTVVMCNFCGVDKACEDYPDAWLVVTGGHPDLASLDTGNSGFVFDKSTPRHYCYACAMNQMRGMQAVQS